MHDIIITHYQDEDGTVVTTAASDPAGLTISCDTSGKIVDVGAKPDQLRPLNGEGLSELFTTMGLGAFAHRYDPVDRVTVLSAENPAGQEPNR